jgi:hypothetical protein
VVIQKFIQAVKHARQVARHRGMAGLSVANAFFKVTFFIRE